MNYAFLSIGFALCLYGLTPLSGSGYGRGISERGALAILAGLAIVAVVGVVTVLP